MSRVLIQTKKLQIFLDIKGVGGRALHYMTQSIEFLELLINMVYLQFNVRFFKAIKHGLIGRIDEHSYQFTYGSDINVFNDLIIHQSLEREQEWP